MKYGATILLFFALFLSPSLTFAEGEENAGFVNGLWYATPTLFANEPTRIYIALRNHTDKDLTGTVRFTDNGKRIGVSYVSALPGRLVEAWVDWTPGYGEHAIVASLSEVRFHTIGENAQAAEVVSTLAEDTVFVDYDTDKDGVGNIDDLDDDNDTISDVDEGTQGTDPLVATIKKRAGTDPESTEKNNPEKTNDGTERDDVSPTTRNSSTEGLEQYTSDGGIIDTLLTNVTEKVVTAKEIVDTHRAERDNTVTPYFTDSNSSPTNTLSEATNTILTAPPTELATITREKVQKSNEGFLYAIIEGGKALVGGFYTLILFILSSLLAHPALIQLALLFGIIYIVYRISRKFGRRPGY